MTEEALSRVAGESKPGVSRRTIVKGAAWSVPVVAAAIAVPGAAASVCDSNGVIQWGTSFTKTGATTGNGTVTTSSGDVVSFTASTTFGTSTRPYTQHFNAGGPPVSGTGPLGLMLATELMPGQPEAPNSNRDQRFAVITTFTFDKPVSDLTFTIWDIDSEQSPSGAFVYREYVLVDGATPALGSRLQLDPQGWAYSRDWTDVAPNNTNYAATFTVPGPTQTLVVRMNRPMTTAERPESYGAIYLGDVSFTTECPAP